MSAFILLTFIPAQLKAENDKIPSHLQTYHNRFVAILSERERILFSSKFAVVGYPLLSPSIGDESSFSSSLSEA